MLYFPSKSDDVFVLVPLTFTFAPGIGIPAVSVIVPVTAISNAVTSIPYNIASTIKISPTAIVLDASFNTSINPDAGITVTANMRLKGILGSGGGSQNITATLYRKPSGGTNTAISAREFR